MTQEDISTLHQDLGEDLYSRLTDRQRTYVKTLETVVLDASEALRDGNIDKAKMHLLIGLFKGNTTLMRRMADYLKERSS